MTEKRFELLDGVKKGTHSGIWDKLKQNNQRIGDELWLCEVVQMLNEGVMIAEENEQLRKELLLSKPLYSRRQLEKENEHIKQTIKDMINTERTELGRSVLKQLWEQIQ